MEKYFFKIEEAIHTKTDFLFYLRKIDLAKEDILKNPTLLFVQKAENSSLNEVEKVLAEMEYEEESFKIAEQKTFFLSSLKERLLSLPQIRIEIACLFSEEVIFRIKEWFKKELGKNVILDIMVKPSLIGGAIIENNGIRADFSIAKKMKEMEVKIPV